MNMPNLDSAIATLVRPQAQELNHCLLRVYSYLNPPYSLSDGETYQVDMVARKLEMVYPSGPAYQANLQVVATYNRNEQTWLWPRANSSLAPETFDGLFGRISSLKDLEAYRFDKFAVSQSIAFHFAAWIAREAKYFGVYPALFNSDVLVFLALDDLAPMSGYALRDMSCCFCYLGRDQCEKIISVGAQLGICGICIGKFADIADVEFPGVGLPAVALQMDKEGDVEDPIASTPCVACGTYRKRIFGSEASLCYVCLAACAGALNPSQPKT